MPAKAALVVDQRRRVATLGDQTATLTLEERDTIRNRKILARSPQCSTQTSNAVLLGEHLEDVQSHNILLWLSHLDPHAKHTATLTLRNQERELDT